MQFLGLASVAAVIGVAGVSAASTLRGGNEPSVSTSEGSVAIPAGRPAVTRKAPAPKAEAPRRDAVVQQASATPQADSTPVAAAPAPVPVSPAPTAPATIGGGFVLVEGRTQLTDSIYATRAGDSVVVNFDAYGFRTRRSSKLEQSLRLTLPMVFGRMATASIDTLDPGALVGDRDVVGTLARDGMQLKLDNGATARIRVLTRVVTDGPIAIGYLAIIDR